MLCGILLGLRCNRKRYGHPFSIAYYLSSVLCNIDESKIISCALFPGFGRTAVFVITIETEKVNPKTLTKRLSVREATSHIPPINIDIGTSLSVLASQTAEKLSSSGMRVRARIQKTKSVSLDIKLTVPSTWFINHRQWVLYYRKKSAFHTPAYAV